MWASSVLIIIATFAGLLSLWRDEIVSSKPSIAKKETDEVKGVRLNNQLKQAKTTRIKLLSSFFIILTLIFTVFQIYQNNISTNLANAEKVKQHIFDSTKFATIDSIRNVQISAYQAQISAGKTIDSIKIKSSSLIRSLSDAQAEIKVTAAQVNESSVSAKKSFNQLDISSQRLLYPLDNNITLEHIYINIWSDTIVNTFKKFLKENSLTGYSIPITDKFPYASDIKYLMQGLRLELHFSNAQKGNLLILKNQKPIQTLYQSDFEPVDNSGPWLNYSVLSGSILQAEYYVQDNCIFLHGDKIELAIDWKEVNTNSILDLSNSNLEAELVFPTLLEKPGTLKINAINFEFKVNFSGKKYSYSYKRTGENFNQFNQSFKIAKFQFYER